MAQKKTADASRHAFDDEAPSDRLAWRKRNWTGTVTFE